MRIFAIGDLHMMGGADKPMEVFGSRWDNHVQRMTMAWEKTVLKDDVVLIPGDISWAMTLGSALGDLGLIDALPGTKIIIRGNHDYWWTSLTKLRDKLPPSILALQNDSIEMGDIVFAGSRGWLCPGCTGFTQKDERIYQRELLRMKLSLESARNNKKRIICMMHFPPFYDGKPSGFVDLIEEFGVSIVVYGHLHGASCKQAFEGMHNSIEYLLCSSDHLEFMPRLIYECNSER